MRESVEIDGVAVPNSIGPIERVSARTVAEKCGWEWREHPVLGDATDKTQRIFETVWSSAYVAGQDSVESELQVELDRITKELDEYKTEFNNAVDENNRLSRAEKEKDQLIVDLQNRHSADVERLLQSRIQLAKAVGFPEEYVFVPRG